MPGWSVSREVSREKKAPQLMSLLACPCRKCAACWRLRCRYPYVRPRRDWLGRCSDAGSDSGPVAAITDDVRAAEALVQALMRLHNYGCSTKGTPLNKE